MSRRPYSWVACVLLLVASVSCATRTAVPDLPPAAERSEPTSEAELLLRKAAILRAEDRRIVDAALEAEAGAAEPEMRARAVAALGRIGDGRFRDRVAAAASDAHPRVRAAAAFALGLFQDRRGVKVLRELAGDSDPAVRRNAATALGFLGAEQARSFLRALLEDEDTSVVVSAAYAVMGFDDASFAVDELLALVDSERATVETVAIRVLAELASRPRGLVLEARNRVRERLVGLAKDKRAEVRALVARGLAVPTTAEEINTLAELFEDSDPKVRINVVDTVSFLGAPVDPFLGRAVLDEDERVALAALRGLGELRGPAPTDVLAGFLVTSKTTWLRAEAVRALREVEPLELANMAKSASQDPSEVMRRVAASLLVGLEEPGAIEVARALLDDPDPGVRLAAIPAVAGASESLADLLGPTGGADDAATIRAVAAAGAVRLGMARRPAEDREATLALLDALWSRFAGAGDPAVLTAILDAAALGGDSPAGRAILQSGMDHPSRAVAAAARRHWVASTGNDPEQTLPPAADLPVEHYAEVLEWSATPKAAVITVERPGFAPGRFTVRLDTAQAPLTAWNFSRLAESGFYDGMLFQHLAPDSLLETGDPDGDRMGGPGYAIRDEIRPHGFREGTLAMVSTAPDSSGSRWFVTLDAAPELVQPHTAFGRVIQNLPGVVARILPTDRIVSIRVYDGDGSEPLRRIFNPGPS